MVLNAVKREWNCTVLNTFKKRMDLHGPALIGGDDKKEREYTCKFLDQHGPRLINYCQYM